MQLKKRAKPIQFGKTAPKGKETPQEQSVAEVIISVKEEKVTAVIPQVFEHVPKPNEHKEVAEEADVTEVASLEAHTTTLQDEEEAAGAITATKSDTEEPAKPVFSGFTLAEEEKGEKKGSFGFFMILTIVVFLLGLGGIFGYSYVTDNKDIDLLGMVPNFSASPTLAPSSTPIPTPKEVDLTTYTIKVLNGSGTSGAAAKLKSSLIDDGFKVGETTNADNDEYTKTIISANKEVDKDYLKKLQETLEKSYSVDSTIKTIPNAGGADVTVTIGSTKK